MQILNEDFVTKMANENYQYSSFIPASLCGANPYKQAYEKGVKLIGATAHYVTAELDQSQLSNRMLSVLATNIALNSCVNSVKMLNVMCLHAR